MLDLKRSELLVFREPTKTGYSKVTIFNRNQSVRALTAPKVPIRITDMLP